MAALSSSYIDLEQQKKEILGVPKSNSAEGGEFSNLAETLGELNLQQ